MHRAAWLPLAAACGLSTVSGCAFRPEARPPTLTPSSQSAPVLPDRDDPLRDPSDYAELLITRAEAHIEAGRRQFALGHLEQAKREFDLAVEVLLEAPDGARTDPKLGTYLDRLVDRISAFELIALAQGDGFTGRRAEPATIDELLDVSTFPMPAPAATTREAVEREMGRHEIPITPHPKVLSYVELFQGQLRESFQAALDRGQAYLPMIRAIFRAESLPLDLVFVPIVESAFKPTALSRARAFGIWQFMPGTGVENGLRYDWYVDERADPEKATYAAARYLRTLHATHDGNWNLALASYNGGPNRVQRAIKLARSDDFWTLASSSRYLPRETREYVPMILAAIVIAGNPTQFGFTLSSAVPPASEKAMLPVPMDLRKVAEWTGTSVETIQALNPELRRWTTPLKDEDYEINVPAGTAGQLIARITDAAPGELVSVSEYVVRAGDTLSGIGARLGVRWQDIAAANNLTKRSIIRPGQRLLVPMAPSAVLASRATWESGAEVVYRVKRGDTLLRIARLHDTTVASIKTWNNLTSDRINVGDLLSLFPRGTR